MTDALAKAIRDTLISPNETDRNLEPANVVDGLFAIARGLEHISQSLDDLVTVHNHTPNNALSDIASAIGDCARAMETTPPYTDE